MSADGERIRNIAIFWDFENIHLRRSSTDILSLSRFLDSLGKAIVRKAYADWKTENANVEGQLFQLGFTPVEIYLPEKNTVDLKLSGDALEILFQNSSVDAFVIISGDYDYRDLADKIRKYNRELIIVYDSSNVNHLVLNMADEKYEIDRQIAGWSEADFLKKKDVFQKKSYGILLKAIRRIELRSELPKSDNILLEIMKDNPRFNFVKAGFTDFLLFLKNAVDLRIIYKTDQNDGLLIFSSGLPFKLQYSIEHLSSKFQYLTALGWNKSTRAGSIGLGQTLEDLLGTSTGLLKADALDNIEIKTISKESQSLITLLVKTPIIIENQKMRAVVEKYGYPSSRSSTSLFVSMNSKRDASNDWYLNVNTDSDRIEIKHEEKIVAYQSIGQLVDILKQRLKNLVLVTAETKRESNETYYRYISAELLLELSKAKIISALISGDVKFDWRASIQQNNVLRDHGSAYRASTHILSKCFERSIDLVY